MSSRPIVVGATGFVGRTVVDRFRSDGVATTGTFHRRSGDGIHYDFWEDDFSEVADETAGTVVFAAHVEGAEDGRSFDSFENACERFVRACANRRLVYVSSDAVFAGERGRYTESDTVDPISEYGRRLRTFERTIERYCEDYCIVRPSYVYGFSRGDLDDRLSETRDRLEAGETPRYYDDYFKSPIEVTRLADAIQTLAMGDVQGVVHAGGPRTSVYEFYRDAVAALGYPPRRIEAESIPEDSGLPRDTSLDSSRLADRTGIEPSGVTEALRGSDSV